MAQISVIVHTKNAAATLEQCLASIQPLASEIIVMDMASTDDTLKIAKKFKAKILHHEDVGYADPARQEAINAAREDWIFVIDADEEISAPLADTIQSLVANPEEFVAFAFPRQNLIFGQWAKTGWWPDYQRRLFKRGHVQWPPQLHGQPIIDGPLQELPANEQFAITHHNYTDIDSFVDRAQRYSSLAAQEMSTGERQATPDLFQAWWQEFMRRWFTHQGYEQGAYGQTLAMLQAYFEVLALSKYWQKENFQVASRQVLLSEQLQHALKEARYWEAQQNIEQTSGLTQWYWRLRRKLRV